MYRHTVCTSSIVFLLLTASLLWGCDDDPAGDAGPDGDADADSSPDGDVTPCTDDDECDDGLFCNGEELCTPGAPGADARGCLSADEGPCEAGQECIEAEQRCGSDCEAESDGDGDGHDSIDCGGDDCDDADGQRYPGNLEVCDAVGHDEDCNQGTVGGLSDGDRDGDGYFSVLCCNLQDDGSLQCGDDCNDASMEINPEASEICNGFDENCDGEIDEGVILTFYRDQDSDGFGTLRETTTGCELPAGYSMNSTDCDDLVINVHPAATEVCDGLIDHDCDGVVDNGCDCALGETRDCGATVPGSDPPVFLTAGPCEPGIQRCAGGTWADSCVGAVYPEGEICDLIDNDCDGEIDDSAAGGHIYYLDADSDGYGRLDAPIEACSPPIGYTENSTDCDDEDASVHPGAREVCDGIDSDCNGFFDGGGEDDDGDGYADADCVGGDDCDDEDVTINPGVVDLCDGIDNDCNGLFDGPGEDDDGDGYVDTICGGDDCDDDDAAVHPGSTEVCDGADNDCDGIPDNAPVIWCDDAIAISAGLAHTCAIRATHQVVCWGSNSFGQLGDGTTADRYRPVEVSGLSDAIDISVGDTHSCAIRSGGQAVCWGSNSAGQLGDDSILVRRAPVNVVGLADAVRITTGGVHSCAIRSGGQAVCWGNNSEGQLGDDSYSNHRAPADVHELSNAIEIEAGQIHTCAIRDDAHALCWGEGAEGRLGNDSNSDYRQPVSVYGLDDATYIAAGGSHSCAVRSLGQAVCWGSNRYCQLGNGRDRWGDCSDSLRAQSVIDLSNAFEIAAGGSHSCAIRFLGQAVCWGSNSNGQLGNGGTIEAPEPIDVTDFTDALHISTGASHTCAIRESGQVACWGSNASGQLGDDSTEDRHSPVVVVSH